MKLNSIIGILILQLSLSCHKINDNQLKNCSYDEAVSYMPNYERLILYLLEQDFKFWSFRKYIDSNKLTLPEKLVVLRHDVHGRDITPAYYMYRIEKELLNEDCSTYFVMLNYPTEKNNTKVHQRYLNLISFLHQEGVDVQPHISPNDMISDYYPEDGDWSYEATTDSLQKLFDKNYNVISDSVGRELIIIGEDVFNLTQKLATLSTLLISYNKKWENETNCEVNGYAAHGSSIPFNKVFNNAIILDLKVLLMQEVYTYDAYNTNNFVDVSYLSDSYKPNWMTNPQLITKSKFRMLCHPNQWYENN